LITRVPPDREGRFATEIFARYEHSEKALVAALGWKLFQNLSRLGP